MPIQESDKTKPSYYDGDACMLAIARVTAEMPGATAFCVGQAIKYLWRSGSKPGESVLEDCGKASWYLDWIERQQDDTPTGYVLNDRERRLIKAIRDVLSYTAPECRSAKIRSMLGG